MEFTWLSSGHAPIVVEAVGDGGILLDLDQQGPLPDRVDSPRRDLEEVAGMDRTDMLQVLPALLTDHLLQFFLGPGLVTHDDIRALSTV